MHNSIRGTPESNCIYHTIRCAQFLKQKTNACDKCFFRCDNLTRLKSAKIIKYFDFAIWQSNVQKGELQNCIYYTRITLDVFQNFKTSESITLHSQRMMQRKLRFLVLSTLHRFTKTFATTIAALNRLKKKQCYNNEKNIHTFAYKLSSENLHSMSSVTPVSQAVTSSTKEINVYYNSKIFKNKCVRNRSSIVTSDSDGTRGFQIFGNSIQCIFLLLLSLSQVWGSQSIHVGPNSSGLDDDDLISDSSYRRYANASIVKSSHNRLATKGIAAIDNAENVADSLAGYMDKMNNLERSVAAVLMKVAYGTTSTTKRSIPDSTYISSITTMATPLLTTLRSTSYTQMIDWSSFRITEPPCLQFYCDTDLQELQNSNDVIKIPDFLCHSQNTERFVQVVSDSCTEVADEERLRYIFAKLSSRERYSKLKSRKDLA